MMGAIYVRYHAGRREAEDVMFALGDEIFAWVVDEFPDGTVELQVSTAHDGEVHEPDLDRFRVKLETLFVELGVRVTLVSSGFSTGFLRHPADEG